jgi:Arc/MetJ-type ribon-helix-helix transcriptional regulator
MREFAREPSVCVRLSLQADFLHHGGTSGTLPINLFFMYYGCMARKQRGRPATGQVSVTVVRLPPELKSKVGAWANRQKDRPSLSKAIRRLLEKSLARTIAPRQRSQGARKAADMAAREIDRLGDESASGEERASRKRRLLSGPKEFRDMRRK